jgi:hypothetical protein
MIIVIGYRRVKTRRVCIKGCKEAAARLHHAARIDLSHRESEEWMAEGWPEIKEHAYTCKMQKGFFLRRTTAGTVLPAAVEFVEAPGDASGMLL